MNVKTRPEALRPSPSASGTTRVEKTPGICGGDACIRKTRITVEGLVEWRGLGLSDAEILDRYPSLTRADLAAAWAYYERYPHEIQEAIRENEAA